MDLIKLNGLVRTAVKLIRGLEITQTDTQFRMAVVSIISWFKVVETYPMDGTAVQVKRRDLRRGKHRGSMQSHPGGEGLLLSIEWDDPLAGRGMDEFFLVDPDTLHVKSTFFVGASKAQYTMVYCRQR